LRQNGAQRLEQISLRDYILGATDRAVECDRKRQENPQFGNIHQLVDRYSTVWHLDLEV